MTQRVVLADPGDLDTSVATLAQPVATGVVELWGLPGEVGARRDAAAAG
jgi:hypothetical protein